MSNTTTYKTEIVVPKPQLQRFGANIRECPCMQLLAAALQRVAAEHGGSVQDFYQDCTGAKHNVALALVTPALPRGLGMEINPVTGQTSIIYDKTNGSAKVAGQIRKDIARVYATLGTLRGLKSIHYAVRVVDERTSNGGRKVALEGLQV